MLDRPELSSPLYDGGQAIEANKNVAGDSLQKQATSRLIHRLAIGDDLHVEKPPASQGINHMFAGFMCRELAT